MALTNYILQSVICGVLFYGFDLGLYEQVRPSSVLAIAPGIYLAQVAFSAWWLRFLRYGPWSGSGARLPAGSGSPCAARWRCDGPGPQWIPCQSNVYSPLAS
jgi:hypothetical protein